MQSLLGSTAGWGRAGVYLLPKVECSNGVSTQPPLAHLPAWRREHTNLGMPEGVELGVEEHKSGDVGVLCKRREVKMEAEMES